MFQAFSKYSSSELIPLAFDLTGVQGQETCCRNHRLAETAHSCLVCAFCTQAFVWLFSSGCTSRNALLAVYPSHYLFSGYLVWQHYTAQHYQDWSEASSNSILRCMYVCMYYNVTKVEYLLLSLEALGVLEPVVHRCYILYMYIT